MQRPLGIDCWPVACRTLPTGLSWSLGLLLLMTSILGCPGPRPRLAGLSVRLPLLTCFRGSANSTAAAEPWTQPTQGSCCMSACAWRWPSAAGRRHTEGPNPPAPPAHLPHRTCGDLVSAQVFLEARKGLSFFSLWCCGWKRAVTTRQVLCRGAASPGQRPSTLFSGSSAA